jgi:hypothetical protein
MKKRTWLIAAVVFTIVGVSLVISSALLEQNKFRVGAAICLNLGLATLAVLLVDVIWRLVGGNPLDVSIAALDGEVRELAATTRAIERARRVGLDDLFARQGDFGTQESWENLLRGAHKNIDIMARTAFGWSKSHLLYDILSDRISHDVNVRWLMMSRHNRYLRLLEEEDSPSSALLDGKLLAIENVFTEYANAYPKRESNSCRYGHTAMYHCIVRLFVLMTAGT